jgi:hypothetical protein
MSEQLEYKYKLFKGSDDQVYVSVGLLMGDIKSSIEQMMDINIDQLDDDNKRIFELKILGLKTEELNGTVPLNVGGGVISLDATTSQVH